MLSLPDVPPTTRAAAPELHGSATRVARQLTHDDVEACLTELCCVHGVPAHWRSDHGPEFTTQQVRSWLNELGAQTLFIERGSPRENGYIESFNGKMRDELLIGEIVYTIQEA